MCRLLETIKLEDGKLRNLEYHNRRFNASRKEMFGIAGDADLASMISVPDDLGKGLYRCRVIYRNKIEKIEFIPHESRIVRSLKLVKAVDIDYSFKYADRSLLEILYDKRGDCDEILIVKDRFITDTSISNIAFRCDDGSWVTPDTPLLNGTMRMYLLDSGQIGKTEIRYGDLTQYTGAKMINCMMDLDSAPLIEMDRIID